MCRSAMLESWDRGRGYPYNVWCSEGLSVRSSGLPLVSGEPTQSRRTPIWARTRDGILHVIV